MQQIKIFAGQEDRISALERDINDWLKQSGARVIQTFGNIAPQALMKGTEAAKPSLSESSTGRRFAPSDILICVVYETN
ncbi:MAG: hypothetical protein JNM80_07390 [Phycisphaerae bacterium]|nr:hypothetical protein [Phycisphaerae bacterium]